MIETVTSGVLRMEQAFRKTEGFSGCDGLSSRNGYPPVTHDLRWKLLLGPTEPPTGILKDQMNTDFPMGKTTIDIFSDFMRYLFDSAKAFFIPCDQSGVHLWNSVSKNVELVLTHPNGWGISQQNQLRTAAVKAKIVPDTPEGRARVHFVTEGEAYFNFWAARAQAGENLKVRRYHHLHHPA